MDTYGDMVTLLLCFFVLLYSISTVDVVKWRNFVKSMNPDAKEVTQLVLDTDAPPDNEEVPGGTDLEQSADKKEIDDEFDSLYEKLQEMSEQSDGEVFVTKGQDYVFIMFRDRIIFDGDSWELHRSGKKTLDDLAKIIKPSQKSIKEMQIMGHTTQALPNRRNEVEKDRTLSSMRSAIVTAYIQEKGVISARKLVNLGYGQNHPIASFKTEKDRSMNRRVEIMISKTGGSVKSIEDYYNMIYPKED